MAELVCVGCGPGDPELLTVKAVTPFKQQTQSCVLPQMRIDQALRYPLFLI